MDRKTQKIYTVIGLIILSVSAVSAAYQFFIAPEPDQRTLKRALTTFIVFIIFEFRVNRRHIPALNRRLYKKSYAAHLGSAFENDKKSLNSLLYAIGLFNSDKCQKAIGYLYQLEAKCKTPDDYAAVYFFTALCFEELEMSVNAMESYENLLSHKPDHSIALSNLGLLYQYQGNSEKAFVCYLKAVKADPSNAFAHSNLANHYLREGKPEAALKSAKEAMRLDLSIKAAISAAAVASAQLGLNNEAMEYCRLYGKHGGNTSELEEILEGHFVK